MPASAPLPKPLTSDPSFGQARAFHHGNLRQALLDAALRAPDIEGLSLRQIAVGVGVTAAAAYRHFESREHLLEEVARIGFDRLELRFAAAFDIACPPADAQEAQRRMVRLAQAYLQFAEDEPALWRLLFGDLQFAEDEPALWRLLFGVQGAGYRANAQLQHRRSSYDYLPAALMGLHRAGLVPRPPDGQDALFAWSAIHGAASLRNGRVAAALQPVQQLAREVAQRVIRSMQ